MTEKQLTVMFAKYLKSHPREDTETYEIKMVKAKTFNPKVVAPHQVEGLMNSKTGLWHKIVDAPAGTGGGSAKKPFDGVWIVARRAYVVPIFYEPRKFKKAFLIPVDHFLKWGKSVKFSELEQMGFESFYI